MSVEHIRAAHAAANDFAPWGAVDTSILSGGRRPAPRLPIQVFGPFWSQWITDHGEGKSAPPDYVAGSLLAGASALIGNARWCSPWDGWAEPPVLWVALIGNPSSSKSPAQDSILNLLREFEAELAEDFPEQVRDYETAKESAKITRRLWESEVEEAVKKGVAAPQMPAAASTAQEPARPRLRVSDITPERMGTLLAQNPKGLLYHRDELSGWLGNFDRYGGGGERAFWLEAFGGRSYVIDRVKHGTDPLTISHLSLSIFGGIQPDRLATALLSGDDDGLAARFLYLWPEPVPCRRPQRKANDAPALQALRRLLNLRMAVDDHERVNPVFAHLAEDAAALFQEWREEHARGETSVAGRMLGHHGKLPGIVLRLALTLEYLWWAADPNAAEPEVITRRAVASVTGLVDRYFLPMAERAFGDAALPDDERGAVAIARKLTADPERPTLINAREIRRNWKLPSELRKADQIKAALLVLEDAGIVRPVPTRAGTSTGRMREDYEVNPLLWEDRS